MSATEKRRLCVRIELIDNIKSAAKRAADASKAVKAEIRDNLDAVKQRDPAAKSDAETLLLNPGVHAILAYRVAHKLWQDEHFLAARAVSTMARHRTGIEIHPGATIGYAARAVSQVSRMVTGIEIHPGATIGKKLFIDHGMGVVIGETAEIGDNCTLYQGVTLGGTGKDVGKRHPTLGDNVLVGSGAKVLGPLTIADNCKIAAGAVVLANIPDNSTAVGVPARIVRRHGRKVADDLDQVHIPDPVANEIKRQKKEINDLKKRLEALEAAGITATVRRTLGSDIDASCGQLRKKYEKSIG